MGVFKDVPRVFQGCIGFHEFLKDISWVFQGSIKGVAREFLGVCQKPF